MPHAIEPIAPRGREAHWCQKYTRPEQPELRHCTVSQLPCATPRCGTNCGLHSSSRSPLANRWGRRKRQWWTPPGRGEPQPCYLTSTKKSDLGIAQIFNHPFAFWVILASPRLCTKILGIRCISDISIQKSDSSLLRVVMHPGVGNQNKNESLVD